MKMSTEDHLPCVAAYWRKLHKVLKVVVEPPPEVRQSVEEFNASIDECHIHLQLAIGIDMGKWAELAGFDEWEMQVSALPLDGVSRDKAFAEQPDEPCGRTSRLLGSATIEPGTSDCEILQKCRTEMSRSTPKSTLEK